MVYDEGLVMGTQQATLEGIQKQFPSLCMVCAPEAIAFPTILPTTASVAMEQPRIVIFTSGTTGMPKGVRLPHRSYVCNRRSFEQFLGFEADPRRTLVLLVCNPMHHTNSTATSDWSLRRPGAQLHLFAR
jgi:long-subunit acyl-CoA synthetase (AMP-forming)